LLDIRSSLQTTFWIIHPHTTDFFLFSMSHVSDSSSQTVAPSWMGGPPSWAVSRGPYVLSRASIVWPSHTCGMLATPPDVGAHILFLRPFKEPHQSFFHLYWSRSCCCLRRVTQFCFKAKLSKNGIRFASVLHSTHP
jgi:hypothetical protein